MEKKNNMNMIVSVIICLVLVGFLTFITIKQSNMNSNSTLAGSIAKIGDKVSVNYTGKLQNGVVFDSNVDPKFKHVEPLPFTIGAGKVIPGWEKGIVGMKVGERKTLTIPPEDAYGANGFPGVIPPNSTLIFDVELVAINK